MAQVEATTERVVAADAEAVFDALADYSDHAMPVPDTGSLREDLRQLLTALGAFLDTPEGPALLHLSIAPATAETRTGRDRAEHLLGAIRGLRDRAE